MIIQCPYCATRYQLDAARLTGANPSLKCSRCRRVFPAPSSKKSPVPRPAGPGPVPPARGELTLPFEDASWKEDSDPADDLQLLELEDRFTLGTEAADEAPLFGEKAAATVPPVQHSEVGRTSVADSAPRERKGKPRRGEPPRDTHERGKVRVILFFLALVVGAYAVLARAFLASPTLSDRLLSKMPLIAALGVDRLMVRKVALSEVTGTFQRIKDGKAVFVVTGKALNTAPVALQGVQIAANLYDAGGRELDRKTIYCGNVISVKVLKDLTQRELSVLQTFSPPKRFMIEPGATSAFVIVFLEPPADAVEFSTKVIAAQRQA